MTIRDDAADLLAHALAMLSELDRAPDDAARIDRIAALERLRGAVAAAQAAEMVEFEESQVAEQRESGVPRRTLGRGVADQIALARKASPATGSHQLSFARSLVKQLPQTRKLLAAGRIGERAAEAMVRETAELTREDRRRMDADLAPDLAGMTERETAATARRLAYELDPESVVRRGHTARKDRRVSIRPAPDTMTMLTGFLPVEQGIAAWASLDRDASRRKAEGDTRTRGQIMADTLVRRLTGQATAADVPVHVSLTMTADTFIGGEDTPGDVDGRPGTGRPRPRACRSARRTDVRGRAPCAH